MVIWRRMYSNMKSKGHPDYGSCPDGHYGLHGSVSNKPFLCLGLVPNGTRTGSGPKKSRTSQNSEAVPKIL